MPSESVSSRLAIITDSSACIPPGLLEAHSIAVVPLHFQFDGEQFCDGQLPPALFYERLAAAHQPPTTSAPASGEFLDAFRRAREAGAAAVLCLTLSAAYSGTYQAARNAMQAAVTELPGLRVDVVDTGGLAMTHGFAVLAAARAARAGAPVDEVARIAQGVGGRARMAGALDSLRFLAKGGRVPWVVHWAAALLRIHPVMAFGDGKPSSIARVRTQARAMDELVRFLGRGDGPPEKMHVAVMHANAPEAAEALADRVRNELAPAELLITEFTPVMGVHTGPGFFGIAFYAEEETGEPPAGAKLRTLLQRDAAVLEGALGDTIAAGELPVAVVLSGPPGAGKSHLARALAARHPFAQLDSDLLRRALIKRPAYSLAESARLFAAYHEVMDRLLARGVSVICDATNLKEIYRRPLYEIAEKRNAKLVVVQVESPREVVEQRLDRRLAGAAEHDESEAGHDIYERLLAEAEPIQREHIVVDATGDISGAVERIMRAAGAST
ncbi:MAG TPA: DegV family protein [Dehalococcoidia bacterium]|nr:DegV family protein [Dehalococcoidia bacterium]